MSHTPLKKKTASVCVRECVFTLDGDLGIGGGPPGLRLWLDGSFPLGEYERETERERQRKRETEKK